MKVEIGEKDFVGVMGGKGGGKRRLMKIILGLVKGRGGKIEFFDEGKEVSEIRMGYLGE